MFRAKVRKRTAGRLMKYQRLQSCRAQPRQKIGLPRAVALRQNAKTQMMRATNGGMQIQMPAYPRLAR